MDYQRIAGLVAETVLGDPNAKLLAHEEIRTPGHLVFRLEYLSGGTPKELFVKLPLVNDSRFQYKAERLRIESDLTQRVKSAFSSDPELDTVSSAGFIDEIDAMVTWGIHGDSLQTRISSKLRFRYLRKNPELERLSGLAGKWLRNFHELDLAVNKNHLRGIVSSYCEYRLELLARAKNNQISESLAETIKSNISGWLDDSLANPETEVVLCHNDFSPHNIIVTKTGISVLDFSFATVGLKAFDLACFWHKLEDMKRSAIRGNRGIDAIQNCFLDAYGSDFDFSRPEVKLGLSRLVLSKMLTLLNSRSIRLYGWMENRRRYSDYLALLESGFESIRR